MTLLLTREAKAKKNKKIKMLPLTKVRRIEASLARKIKAPMHDMIIDIIDFLKPFAKVEAQIAKESFYMPDVNKIMNKYKNDIYTSIQEETRKSSKMAAIYTAQTFKTPFDARFYNQYVEPVIMNRKFKIISTTITKNIENQLKGGLLAMLQKGATARQTIDYFKGLKTNYRSIARTEVLSAANQSSWTMANKEADEVGIKHLMDKTWNVTNINERHWNDNMNGQTVKFNEFFDVAGEPASHPQDSSLSASNFINCQCYMTRQVVQ